MCSVPVVTTPFIILTRSLLTVQVDILNTVRDTVSTNQDCPRQSGTRILQYLLWNVCLSKEEPRKSIYLVGLLNK